MQHMIVIMHWLLTFLYEECVIDTKRVIYFFNLKKKKENAPLRNFPTQRSMRSETTYVHHQSPCERPSILRTAQHATCSAEKYFSMLGSREHFPDMWEMIVM